MLIVKCENWTLRPRLEQIKEYFLRVKILGTPGHQNRMTNPNLQHKTKRSTTGLKSRPWQNNDKQCYHRYMGSNVFDMVSNILVCLDLDWYCFISWLILDCQKHKSLVRSSQKIMIHGSQKLMHMLAFCFKVAVDRNICWCRPCFNADSMDCPTCWTLDGHQRTSGSRCPTHFTAPSNWFSSFLIHIVGVYHSLKYTMGPHGSQNRQQDHLQIPWIWVSGAQGLGMKRHTSSCFIMFVASIFKWYY